MPSTTTFLNDVDLGLYGCWCNFPAGWADGPSQADQFASVPGQAGALLLTTEADVSSRTLELTGVLIASDNATARANWDSIKALLASPVVEIRFQEYPDRMIVGRYRSGSFRRPLWGAYGSDFTIQFLCPNPHPVARAVTVYTVSEQGSTVLTLGTAPSVLDLHLIGMGAVNPTVTYTDAQGNQKGLVRFLLTLPAGEWIEWKTMPNGGNADWHRLGGSIVNAMPFLDPNSMPFAADPLDGDGTVGPTVSLVNAAGVLMLRKSWK